MRVVFLVCVLTILPAAGFGVGTMTQSVKKPAAGAPPPPPLPLSETRSTPTPNPEPETGLEPEITITTRGETTYEEYRANGQLYMIKVIPKQGKPYYLIDKEGSGQFRRSDIEPTISVPMWIIKSW